MNQTPMQLINITLELSKSHAFGDIDSFLVNTLKE